MPLEPERLRHGAARRHDHLGALVTLRGRHLHAQRLGNGSGGTTRGPSRSRAPAAAGSCTTEGSYTGVPGGNTWTKSGSVTCPYGGGSVQEQGTITGPERRHGRPTSEERLVLRRDLLVPTRR